MRSLTSIEYSVAWPVQTSNFVLVSVCELLSIDIAKDSFWPCSILTQWLGYLLDCRNGQDTNVVHTWEHSQMSNYKDILLAVLHTVWRKLLVRKIYMSVVQRKLGPSEWVTVCLSCFLHLQKTNNGIASSFIHLSLAWQLVLGSYPCLFFPYAHKYVQCFAASLESGFAVGCWPSVIRPFLVQRGRVRVT